MLKIKPWWLSFLTGKDTWITLAPNIYHPKTVDPLSDVALLAHKNIHLVQQSLHGKYSWLLIYACSKSFRLNQEVRAIAAEILSVPSEKQQEYITRYAYALASPLYHNAAKSMPEAYAAIYKELSRILS